MRRLLRWIGLGAGAVVLLALLLDTFGGHFMDGPLGPIPGGRMSGPVVDAAIPLDWTGVEREIEIEVRPEQPWSLTVWRAVIDGDLYVPSGGGARRRWTRVAIADPRVRVRSQGRIQEGCLVRIEDPGTRARVLSALVDTYSLSRDGEGDDGSVWVFRIDPRSKCA